MRKYIALAVTLVMLISSIICSIFFANKWIMNKNKVIDLSARLEELSKQLDISNRDSQDRTEMIIEEKYKSPIVQEANLKINSEDYILSQRTLYFNYENLELSYQPLENKNIIAYFNNTRSLPYEIDIDGKIPLEIKVVPYGADEVSDIIVMLFEDGTISYTTYDEQNKGKRTLHSVSLDKKAIGIEAITLTNQTNNLSMKTAAAILEDGSSVEIKFNIIEN